MKKFLLAFSLIVITAFTLYAQPPGTRPPVEPPLIPIDGGASYLIAAGLLIGIKKLISINKKK